MPDARHDRGLVGLNLHAATAPVALLSAPQFAVDGCRSDRYSGGEARQGRDKALAMGLPSGFETKHLNFYVDRKEGASATVRADSWAEI